MKNKAIMVLPGDSGGYEVPVSISNKIESAQPQSLSQFPPVHEKYHSMGKTEAIR